MSSPAGWYPDPHDGTQFRYWDGTQWTDHRSPRQQVPPAPASAPPLGGPAGQPETTATPSGRFTGWVKRHPIWSGVIALVILVLVISAAQSNSNDKTTATPNATEGKPASSTAPGPSTSTDSASPRAAKSPTPTAKPKATPTAPAVPTYGKQPEQEKTFTAAVEKAQGVADRHPSSLQIGAAKSNRDSAICSAVGDAKVRDWVGKVTTLSANGDGNAVLAVDIADDDSLSTWNNDFSDYSDNTLIAPGTLFDKVVKLKEGELVTFSGQFFPDSGGCFEDQQILLTSKVSGPTFVFRFSDVTPAS